MNVDEALARRFQPRMGHKVQALLHLYGRAVDCRVVVHSWDALAVEAPTPGRQTRVLLTVRDRQDGAAARLRFTCDGDHGFSAAALQVVFGGTGQRIIAASRDRHLLQVTVGPDLDLEHPALLRFVAEHLKSFRLIRT